MFCHFSKCCCGCSLRGGTIGIAIYTLVIGLITAAIYGLGLKGVKDAKSFSVGDLFGGDSSEFNDLVQDSYDNTLETAEITLTISLVLVVLWAVAALLLFVAICSKVRWLLLPWVVFTLIFTIFSLYQVYYYVAKIIAGEGSGVVFFSLGLVVSYELLNIYFILVIMSYFRVDMEESASPV